MRLLRFILFSLCTMYYVLCTTPVHALTPTDPFSEDGNPKDEYLLNNIFPLFRFVKADKLLVYENATRGRSSTPATQCGDTRPQPCSSNATCTGIVSYCDEKGNLTENVNVSGTCTGLDPEDPTVEGSCNYPDKNPTISLQAQGTDFARDPSVPHDPEDTDYFLAFPKFQNEALRYQNTCQPDNPITCGAHNLILNRCDRVARQLMVAYQAYETRQTFEDTNGQWPLGWVDWGYKTKDGTLLNSWEKVSRVPELAEIARDLVNAQDDFFLNLGSDKVGQQQIFPSTNQALPRLCNLVNQADSAFSEQRPEWLQTLELLPIYPPSFRQGYLRTSICIFGDCNPSENSDDGQYLYADTSIRAAYAGAISDLFFSQTLNTALGTLNAIADANPLIRYALSTKPRATPPRIEADLKTNNNIPPELRADFTFARLGFIYDHQSEMDKYGYTLQPEGLSQEEGGALDPSLGMSIINFAYGLVSSALPIEEHIITIPEVLGQAYNSIQMPNYNSRDTLAELENKYADGLSNIADGTSIFLTIGKGLAVGDARRRLAYYTCDEPQYSAPQELESIKAYALGTRAGCFPDSEESTTTPTEVNCTQDVPDQSVPGLNVEAADSYTKRLFEGCVGNSAWMQCHNDAAARAKAVGVDPLFTLAIWIHESGASNYECGRQKYNGDKFLDFGFNDDSIAENFSEQLDSFLNLPGAYTNRCEGGNNLNTFISLFWFGNCYEELPADQQNLVALYISDLEGIYNVITNGSVTLSPTFWP